MKLRRVKITGIGPVTPAGIGREAFLRGMLEPVSRVGVKVMGEGSATRLVAAAEVRDFRIGAFGLDASYLSSPRHVQLALAATALALRDAGLVLGEVRKQKPLVVLARPSLERGSLGVVAGSRADGPKLMQQAVSQHVGACVEEKDRPEFYSALDAIGYAALQVASGRVNLAICGGADSPLSERLLAEMQELDLSSGHARAPERQCRPFDLWRTTGVAGEGACVFVLEPEESKRRAYAHVDGAVGVAEKSGRAWEPLGEAVRLALGNARLRPADIDCIHADGTGHKTLDLAEVTALRSALRGHLDALPVVSIKGAVGNALGAAGAIQVGCAALGTRHSIIPPTVNWSHPDPSCLLNLSTSPRQISMDVTLVASRDPSGAVTCLLLSQ